ncbi:MAG: hypothetical protein WED00_09815 [Aquisalimonadaceae bacterium]
MSRVCFTERVRPLLGWLAIILFAVFFANIVLAKAASMADQSVPLLPNLGEFLLLHAATITLIAYLLCEEARKGLSRPGPEGDQSGGA